MLKETFRQAAKTVVATRLGGLSSFSGLVLGLSVLAIVATILQYELSHDKAVPFADRLFRLDTIETIPGQPAITIARTPGPLAEQLMANVSGVDAVARAFEAESVLATDTLAVSGPVLVADTAFPALLGVKAVAGELDQFGKNPNTILIDTGLAETLFGSPGAAIGKTLVNQSRRDQPYRVSGVYEAFGDMSHLKGAALIPTVGYFTPKEQRSILDFWGGAYFHTYVRVKDGSTIRSVINQLPSLVNRVFPDALAAVLKSKPSDFLQFTPVNVRDIHLDGAPLAALKPGGDKSLMLGLAVTVILTLLVATFNYAIMGTARTLLRTKEIAVHKVHGATRPQILLKLFFENGLTVLAASIIALAVSEFALPLIDETVGASYATRPGRTADLLSVLGFASIIMAVLTCLLPALQLSGAKPASLFKPIANSSVLANRAQSLLLSAQILVTACLLTVTLGMANQQQALLADNPGFDATGVALVKIPEGVEPGDAGALVSVLRAQKSIRSVSLSSSAPTLATDDNLSIQLSGGAKPVQLGFHQVDPAFFETLGITARVGRVFSPTRDDEPEGSAFDKSDRQPIVINERALKSLGIASGSAAIGSVITSTMGQEFEIVGVIANTRFKPAGSADRSEIFLLGKPPAPILMIKAEPAEVKEATAQANRLLGQYIRTFDLRFEPLQQRLDRDNASVDRQLLLLGSFTTGILFLTAIGLQAVLQFRVTRRRRELAIRRVYGATLQDLFLLLSKGLTAPLFVATVATWPVSWLILTRWQQQFADQATQSPFIYAASLVVIVGAASLLTARTTVSVSKTKPALILRDS